MYELELKLKKGKNWVIAETPQKLSEQIIILESLIGQDAALRITTMGLSPVIPVEGEVMVKTDTFVCGTEALMKQMHKIFPEAILIDFQSAYSIVEYAPELFFNIIKAFTTKEEVLRYIAKENRPEINLKEWWTK
jgi:hypothetical protein